MSKRVAFVGLALLAVAFAGLGHRLQANFLSDLWSQLFWLSVGTLATTFVLESILQRGADRRQRSRNAFAFRTFSANMMIALQEIIGLEQRNDKLLEAALLGDVQFKAAAAAAAAALLVESKTFEPSAYEKYYLDIASELRTLSREYIRLFSENQKDTLTQYQELNSLANLWTYKDEFSERASQYRASLGAGSPEKPVRERAFTEQVSSANNLVVNTGQQVARLAKKTATSKGFYD